MLAVLKLERDLVQSLSEVSPNVVSYMPKKPTYPLIHLESIKHSCWLINPLTLEVEVRISIYTNESSNKKLLELGEEVQLALGQLGHILRLYESAITEVKSDLWCNDINLTIWINGDKSYEE